VSVISAATEDLLALARKYQAIARLRRERANDGTVAERSVLRALAREFPGSLRELDTLTVGEIERRERVLLAAAAGGPAEPWMAWMVAYHRTMRAALLVKAKLVRARGIDRLAELAAETKVDPAFVRAVAAPPGGRLNRVVFDRLAAEFGEPADRMWEALFPSRRAGRY
jgi:hypothetical protein